MDGSKQVFLEKRREEIIKRFSGYDSGTEQYEWTIVPVGAIAKVRN